MTELESSPTAKKLLDRYQVTASVYDKDDEHFPGLIIFEFVNYGRGEAELAGILEISEEHDKGLADMVRQAVERMANDSVWPLSAEGQTLMQSETLPKSWRVMLATGSKTDFVLWGEIEAISADGSFTTIRSGHVGGAVARHLQAEWDTVFNAVVERNPTLLPIQHICSTCHADWEAGGFSDQAKCAECGGFAKEIQCNCAAKCGEIVIRDTAATHLSRTAQTFPCTKSAERGVDWTGDPWAAEALARKLHVLSHQA
jgi:hypothetical protein